MVKLVYTTYINVDLEHHEIFRGKVGKGGIAQVKDQQIEHRKTCAYTSIHHLCKKFH